MKVGLVQLVQADKHPSPPMHPENPERISIALDYVLSSDIAEMLDVLKSDSADKEVIFSVHDRYYLEQAKSVAESGGGYLDGDTYVMPQSYKAAMETAEAIIWSAGEISSGKYKRILFAGRPPGHHAEYNRGMGFCIINNTAVAAESLIRNHGLKRVAIIDWDVHHGNGTQHMFYDRSNVFFISLHRYPFYPGSGASAERGEDAGEGYTLNIPLSAGAGNSVYIDAFEKKILPELDKYQPEFIIITAGFDAHCEDLLGGMGVTEDGFGEMTRMLVDVSKKYCGNKILSIMEGGYSPSANGRSLYQHLKELQKE